MKITIISDTHIDKYFDAKKANFIKKLTTECDQIIIAGDFWDSFTSNMGAVKNSKWGNLFYFLEKHQAICLQGNHDQEIIFNNPSQLSNKILWQKQIGNIFFKVTHGHIQHPGWEKLNANPVIKKLRKVISFICFQTIEKHGVKKFGPKFSKVFFYRYQDNRALKNWVKKQPKNQFWIFGHTHLASLDTKHRFANCGYIDYGYASWVEINDGKVELKHGKY